jgi:DNA polymerase III alpha subunit
MQIAQVMAGYTLGGADMLRRAMGKKKPEEMAKQRGGFIEVVPTTRGIDADLSVTSSTWWKNSPVMASTNPTPPPTVWCPTRRCG